MNIEELDTKARNLAQDYLRTEGELLSLLMQMRKQRVFPALNYSGIFDYCERALRFSRAQAFYFKSVAEKAEEVPEIKTAIQRGEITLSEARRIVPVVNPTNIHLWIEKAKTLPQIELEKAVTEVNPKAHLKDRLTPIAPQLLELRTSIDLETEKNIKVLQDLLSQKTKKPATVSDVLKWATQVCREKHDLLLKQKVTTTTQVENPAEKPEALANHTSNLSGAPNRSSSLSGATNRRKPIPTKLKTQISLHDQRQCTYTHKGQRCQQRRWLHLHHIKHIANGGKNLKENLTTLCHAHHRLTHKTLQRTNLRFSHH